jgi:hypothetical protein
MSRPKSKELFSVGTRVCHAIDSNCDEGVIVWKHSEYSDLFPHMKGKVWSVHWSNGKRGIYSNEEIKKIPPKNIKKLVEQQLDDEGEKIEEESE